MGSIWQEKFDAVKTHGKGTALISGVQALFWGQMLMRHVDKNALRRTAGCIVGYRGSPLAGVDLLAERLKKARAMPSDLTFLSAVNEEMAVSIAGGTQMLDDPRFAPYSSYDGVTALVYMKHPGTMRASDAGAHVNYPGVARQGGMVWASGDDPLCTSSTYTSASLEIFRGMKMPVLAPHTVQEIPEYVVRGFQLSRYSGLAVGLSLPASLLDASQIVSADSATLGVPSLPYPEHVDVSWMHFRFERDPLGIEERLYAWKLPAAQAFVDHMKLNRAVTRHDHPVLTIVAVGKALRDVSEALLLLDVDPRVTPVTVVGIGCPYPLNLSSIMDDIFSAETVLLVEEKSGQVEADFMKALAPEIRRRNRIPEIIGRRTVDGGVGFPEWGELRPTQVALEIGRILLRRELVDARLLRHVEESEARHQLAHVGKSDRKAHYCSGCPHNSSTPVPDGAIAMAGIGCHVIEILYADRYAKFTGAMGTEGAHLIGAQMFSTVSHGYQNLGDGTYFHSGILAIRQAVAVRASMTFKILFNDAVAMTGGQRIDGDLTVDRLVAQLKAEGVEYITIVTDDLSQYDDDRFGVDIRIHDRDDMDAVMRTCSAFKGVSVLIYDQLCAAERRRRAKKGTLGRAPTHTTHRVLIHPDVCEGCGDCSKQSNCLSVAPVSTPTGRVREIDQTSCNHDTRCVDGHCPSFVVVEESLAVRDRSALFLPHAQKVPSPRVLPLFDLWDIVIAGIGGTGVLTIEQILAVAGWKQGWSVQSLAMTGMSQKFGAVRSHVRFAVQSSLHASPAVPYQHADLLIGCDVVGASAPQTFACMRYGSSVVLNTHETMPQEFLRHPDFSLHVHQRHEAIRKTVHPELVMAHDFSLITRRVFGDETFTNMVMLGYVSQKGLLPLSDTLILSAIALHGEAVKQNHSAYMIGRLLAHDSDLVMRMVGLVSASPTLTHVERAERLTRYGGVQYSATFHRLVSAITSRVKQVGAEGHPLVEVVSRELYRSMHLKDEYEVARMHASSTIDDLLRETFAVDHAPKLAFYLAPPILERFMPKDGRGLPKKMRIPGWMRPLFRVLSWGAVLRDSPFDPFGYTKDRKADVLWRQRYIQAVEHVAGTLTPERLDLAMELLTLPERIRGYGAIRRASMEKVEPLWRQAFDAYRTGVRRHHRDDALRSIKVVIE